MTKKYQREIEEILKQAGGLKGLGRGRGPRYGIWQLAWLYVRRLLDARRGAFSAGRLMLVAGCLLLFALIVRALVPGLVGPLAVAGLLLFVVAYAMFFLKPSKIEKRWRGQALDDGGDSWWSRLRHKRK